MILAACMDCTAYVANGTVPEDRPNLVSSIVATLGDAEGLVCAGESEDWFSWHPCECCASPLGGNRNLIAKLENNP